MPAAIRQTLADKPGVYRMRSLGGDLLYIGKAKSLKKRVTSYFRSKAPHPEHILEMLSQAQNIDFSLTESALEAAVLETDEIKEHCPPYNKALQPNQRSLANEVRRSPRAEVTSKPGIWGPILTIGYRLVINPFDDRRP
jgi:DNA polymerase III subunit epsilon